MGGIVPNESTIKDGSYAIQRPFILVTKDGVKLSEASQDFFDYITSDGAKSLISEAGVVPAN